MGFVNRKIVLVERPKGRVSVENFAYTEEEIGDLPDGCVLIEVGVLGIDAFIRTTLNEDSFHQGAQIGGAIPALGVGVVLDSRFDGLAAGDHVFGPLGSQTHAVMPGGFMRKIDVSVAPPSVWLGALGLTTGLTAYMGVIEVGRVKAGETVVVSAAAGAVGSLAGQIARLRGATNVIGIAGGPEKSRFLTDELGYTAAIDYKNEDVAERLDALAPNGIDVFFDNVGGSVLDDVLMRIKEGSRIVICGAISQYENMESVHGPRNYLKLAERHATMEGFAVFHFSDRYAEAEDQLAAWVRSGELVMREHIERGVENFPRVLQMLMTGGHHGKLLLAV